MTKDMYDYEEDILQQQFDMRAPDPDDETPSPDGVFKKQCQLWRNQLLSQQHAENISLNDTYELDIAQKRQRLRNMCGLLSSYLEPASLPYRNEDIHKIYLRKYVENLTKKMDSLGYLDVPAHELDDMAKLTFVLIFDWECKHDKKNKQNKQNKQIEVSDDLHQKVSTYGHELAKKVTAYHWARIAGGIALGILGLALVVGAGCMIGASYGALSPFALTVAKFGLGISSVGAAYIFAELMGQAVPAVYHKLRTKEKQSSTAAAMIELAGTARDNSVAEGVMGVAAGSALVGGAAVVCQTASAAITSTVIPTASVAATGTLAVAGTMAAMASTVGAGLMAMYRGTLFVRDAVVRKQIHHAAVDALNVNKLSVGRSNAPA